MDRPVVDDTSKLDRLAERAPDEVRRLRKLAEFVDKSVLNVDLIKETNVLKTATEDFFVITSDPQFRKELEASVTPEERLNFSKKFFKWAPISSETLSKYCRSPGVSNALREEGNELFKSKNFQDALHYYTLATVFAPAESQELGLALGNRSAVFVQLENPHAALEDIDLALAHNYPQASVEKLRQRQITCQKLIQKKKLANEKDKDLISQTEKEIKSRRFMKEKMLRLERPNPMMPAAAECVEIKFDNIMGRYLAVNEDVHAGSVLLVEDPFVFALYGQTKWDTSHCHGCAKRIQRGITCPNCVFAFYCGETCRTKAEQIHQYECSCLPYFHINQTPDQVQLAFRIICKVGPKRLFDLFTTKDPSFFDCKLPYGTKRDRKYESDSYLSVHHLVKHSEKLELPIRHVNAHHALLATAILDLESTFFKEIPMDKKTEFKDFIAAQLLHHIECVSVNSGGMTQVKGMEQVSLADCYSNRINPRVLSSHIQNMDCRTFGQGVYPTYSLMNHSCDPNVFTMNDLSNGTMSVITSRALRRGEPIFLPYVQDFLLTPCEERQLSLQDSYYFTCQCIACKNKWPTLQGMMARKLTFTCFQCSRSFCEHEKGSMEFMTCVLTKPQWKCGLCGKEHTEFELHSRLQENETVAVEASKLLMSNRPREATLQILRASEFYQFHLCPPQDQKYRNQEMLRKAMMLIFYFSQ